MNFLSEKKVGPFLGELDQKHRRCLAGCIALSRLLQCTLTVFGSLHRALARLVQCKKRLLAWLTENTNELCF
jgi:hypothetical protein